MIGFTNKLMDPSAGALTDFKGLLARLGNSKTADVTLRNQKINIYDFLILRRSREGNEVWDSLESHSDSSWAGIMAQKLIMLGWPISKYHLIPKKFLEITKEEREIAGKKFRHITTLRNEKDIRALYELQDYGTSEIKIKTSLGMLSSSTERLIKLLLALGGVDLLAYPNLFSSYPTLQKELETALLPPDKKKMPKITNLLDPLQIFPVKVLGSGTYGAAFVVWIWGYGRAVLKLATPSFPLSLIGECMLLGTLGCENPNVLCLRECIRLPKQFGLITDYYEGYVDLVTWVGCFREEWLNQKTFNGIVATVFRQILLGLQHIHFKKMAHRDIKPENIIIKWDSPMIIDFGAAWSLTLSPAFPGWAGTTVYMPPGMRNLHSQGKIPTFDEAVKADVWAVGASLFDVIVNKTPDEFKERNLADVKSPFKEVCGGLMKGWSIGKALKILADIEKNNK